LFGTISDNTGVMALAKYIIGPVKLYAGYEHLDFNNPNNHCRSAVSFRAAMCSCGQQHAFTTTGIGRQFGLARDMRYVKSRSDDRYYHESRAASERDNRRSYQRGRLLEFQLGAGSGQLDAVPSSSIGDLRSARCLRWRHVVAGAERPCKRFLSKVGDKASTYSPSMG